MASSLDIGRLTVRQAWRFVTDLVPIATTLQLDGFGLHLSIVVDIDLRRLHLVFDVIIQAFTKERTRSRIIGPDSLRTFPCVWCLSDRRDIDPQGPCVPVKDLLTGFRIA